MEERRELHLPELRGKPEEDYVTVRIPRSTYHLFHAVAGHPLVEDLTEYRDHVQKSVRIHAGQYPLPEEYRDLGAPRGELRPGILPDSAFYPGVPHPYWVYVPSSYNGKTPANLALFYDARMFLGREGTETEAPILRLFDNLTASGDLPPTVVLFVSYGLKGPGQPMAGFNEGAVNRSLEYDTASDWHSRFITEEVLPVALRGLKISASPKDHVVLGMSSSGIAAFATAWFQPDLFGKVYQASPSFADIRGGRIWPTVLRVEEKKEIRLFTVAGRYDIDNFFGNWRIGCLDVGYALHYKGYEHRLYFSQAGHSLPVFLYALPEGLRWLFGGKEPVLAGMQEETFADVL